MKLTRRDISRLRARLYSIRKAYDSGVVLSAADVEKLYVIGINLDRGISITVQQKRFVNIIYRRFFPSRFGARSYYTDADFVSLRCRILVKDGYKVNVK
jgi:hypothetical protein